MTYSLRSKNIAILRPSMRTNATNKFKNTPTICWYAAMCSPSAEAHVSEHHKELVAREKAAEPATLIKRVPVNMMTLRMCEKYIHECISQQNFLCFYICT